jgi:hypothetical protein
MSLATPALSAASKFISLTSSLASIFAFSSTFIF